MISRLVKKDPLYNDLKYKRLIKPVVNNHRLSISTGAKHQLRMPIDLYQDFEVWSQFYLGAVLGLDHWIIT